MYREYVLIFSISLVLIGMATIAPSMCFIAYELCMVNQYKLIYIYSPGKRRYAIHTHAQKCFVSSILFGRFVSSIL